MSFVLFIIGYLSLVPMLVLLETLCIPLHNVGFPRPSLLFTLSRSRSSYSTPFVHYPLYCLTYSLLVSVELCTLAREETTTDDWSMPSYWLLLWVTKVQLPITFHLIRAPWHHHPLTPTALAMGLYLNWYPPLLLNWLFSQQFPIPIVCLCNLLIWFEHSFVEQIVRYMYNWD